MSSQNGMGKPFLNKARGGYQLQNRCREDIHDDSMQMPWGVGGGSR